MRRAGPHNHLRRGASNGLTFRDFLDRYGLPLGVIGALMLVLTVIPGNVERAAPEGEIRTIPGASEGTGGVEAIESGPGTAVTGPGATARRGGVAGRTASVGTGPSQILLGQGPCRGDGRMKGITKYMPPCLAFTGDNGGATARGVTRTQIKVARFFAERDPAIQAILEQTKLSDSPDTVKRAYDALRIYSNHHHETYGREIVFEEVKASGPTNDDQAMKRDGIRIAEEIKPFAVIEGDPAALIPPTLAAELVARGVACVCTISLTSQWYLERRPYAFGSLPTFNEYAANVAEFIGKRLIGAGRTAKWAGDPRMRNLPRKFGLIVVVGAAGKVEPEGRRAKEIIVAELQKWGVPLAVVTEYTIDPGRNQNDVTNIIAQMRQNEVTTVIPMVDPIYPILITHEATNQQYFPEWLITGTGLSDTTAAGRLYDQAQWRNAFGLSPLSIIPWVEVRRSTGYREFYHGKPDIRPGSCGPDPCEGVLINVYRSFVALLSRGIHMAGPRLTSDTFAQGLFNFPATGGSPALPLIFLTREHPTEIKDFVEVFYAAEERGFDERGQDGFGMIMKVDLGKRYRPGQWPTSEPKAFNLTNAMAASDNPPGGGLSPHEEDGHTHSGSCISCPR